MKTRIAAIALALLVALVGAVAVIGYAHHADDRAVAGQKVTTVYIAGKDVPQGTSAKSAVDRGLISLKEVVAKGAPQGALTRMPSAPDTQVALSTITAGSIVLADRFGRPSQVQTTSGVPAGRVAISVGMSDPAGVKAYLERGSHIVIYDTFNARGKSGKLTTYGAHLNDDKTTVRGTGVVLPDVPVLSVRSPKNGATGQNSSSPVNGTLLVTVAVTPGDATRLVHAIQTGNLYFGLLGSGAHVDPGATSDDDSVVGR
jgi:pilus assembly protein CpaB